MFDGWLIHGRTACWRTRHRALAAGNELAAGAAQRVAARIRYEFHRRLALMMLLER
jgi:hypothetical protein